MNSSLLNHLHPQQPNTPQQLSFQSQFQRPSINSTLPKHLYSQQPNAPQHSYFQPQSQQPSTNSSLPNHLHQQQSNTPPPPAYPFPTLNSSLQSVSQSPSNWHSGLSPNCYELVVMPKKVKKCYGCGQEFAEKYRTPPTNIVVKHLDRRITGKNAQTGQVVHSGDFTNTYYHP